MIHIHVPLYCYRFWCLKYLSSFFNGNLKSCMNDIRYTKYFVQLIFIWFCLSLVSYRKIYKDIGTKQIFYLIEGNIYIAKREFTISPPQWHKPFLFNTGTSHYHAHILWFIWLKSNHQWCIFWMFLNKFAEITFKTFILTESQI